MNNTKQKGFRIKGKVLTEFRKDGKYVSLIRYVSDINNLKSAYFSIKSRPCNTTLGASNATFDGVSDTYFANISKQLLEGNYKFSRNQQINVPQKSKGKRYLVISALRDKIVLRVLADVLEAIYDKEFSPNSHAFRVNQGCHTALQQVAQQFGGITWVIKGDLTNFFDRINHGILLNKLRVYINDENFIKLITKYLEMSYFIGKKRVVNINKVGVSQASVLTPILSNIYLHSFDIFLDSLTGSFYKEKQTCKNPTYISNWVDPNFRCLYYVRYADSFIIGISGTLEEVKQVHKEIKHKLKMEQLIISNDKSMFTHLPTQKVLFLGTFIQKRIPRNKSSLGIKKITPILLIHAPIEYLFNKLKSEGFFRYRHNRNTPRKQGESNVLVPRSVGRLVNLSHKDILEYYNFKVRGILNYYSFVDNYKSLGSIVHGLKHSCALTLALKFKLRHRAKVFKKFGKRLSVKNSDGELIASFYLPTTFKKTSQFRVREPRGIEEVLAKKWNRRFTDSFIGKNV
jgi:group II intron reverse transcriptase/maturase